MVTDTINELEADCSDQKIEKALGKQIEFFYADYKFKDLMPQVQKVISTHIDEGQYRNGGVTFDDKVESISKSLVERKKVSPSVQKDYGKTYSRKEAIESAKRIAGAMRKKEMAKKK